MDDQIIRYKNEVKEQEQRIVDLTELYEKAKFETIQLKQLSEQGISVGESNLIRSKNEKLVLEQTELKAAIKNYKYLYQASVN